MTIRCITLFLYKKFLHYLDNLWQYLDNFDSMKYQYHILKNDILETSIKKKN